MHLFARLEQASSNARIGRLARELVVLLVHSVAAAATTRPREVLSDSGGSAPATPKFSSRAGCPGHTAARAFRSRWRAGPGDGPCSSHSACVRPLYLNRRLGTTYSRHTAQRRHDLDDLDGQCLSVAPRPRSTTRLTYHVQRADIFDAISGRSTLDGFALSAHTALTRYPAPC